MGWVATRRGNPIDGVVLLTGCDKTTPALLMGAASVDVPSIVLPGNCPTISHHHSVCPPPPAALTGLHARLDCRRADAERPVAGPADWVGHPRVEV